MMKKKKVEEYEPMWIKDDHTFRSNDNKNHRGVRLRRFYPMLFMILFIALISFFLFGKSAHVKKRRIEKIVLEERQVNRKQQDPRLQSVVRSIKQIGQWPTKSHVLVVGDEIGQCGDLSSSLVRYVAEDELNIVFVNMDPSKVYTSTNRVDVRSSLSEVRPGEKDFSRAIMIGCLESSNLRTFRNRYETILSKLPDETPFVVILSSKHEHKKKKGERTSWLASVFRKLVPEAQQFYAMDTLSPEVYLLFGVKVL